jgi:pimeloyl-ACP methyl ester carboxylesterase
VKRFILFFLLLPVFAASQSCCGEHISERFAFITQRDSVFAQNQITYTGNLRDLRLRIYEAVGNDCQYRPLLVLVHGGAFGGGSFDQMGDIANQFARRGYVVISAGYRTGFASSGPLCPSDTTELIRAWYRGIQDIRGAIRWSKDRHEQLRIDTNLVFAAGWSAGAYICSGLAYLDLESEKPPQVNEQPPVMSGFNSFLRPDLGSVQGSLSQGNHSSKIRGFASFSGAFLFPQNIPEGTKPAALFFNNKRDDYSVPYQGCENDVWEYNCPQGYPKVCGIEAMTSTLSELLIPHTFTVYDTVPCGHTMHQPCFPFFLEEMNTMANFFNSQMECNTSLKIAPIASENTSTNFMVAFGTSEIPWKIDGELIHIHSLNGLLVKRTTSKHNRLDISNLEPGHYYLRSSSQTTAGLIVK